MSKPAFNPNQPFEVVQDSKPAFDPNKPFEAVQDFEPSVMDTLGAKLSNGASLGFTDEIAGGLEGIGTALGVKGLGGKIKDVGLSEEGPTLDWDEIRNNYLLARDKERKSQAAISKARPVLSGISELVGGIATIPASGAATLGGRVASAAGLGGVAGLGSSDADSIGGLAADTAIGAVLGGALQFGGEKAVNGLKKVGSYIGDSKPMAKFGKVFAGIDESVTDRYMARADKVNSAESLEALGHNFNEQTLPKLREKIGQLDNEAWNTLSNETALNKNDLMQIGEDFVNRIIKGKNGNLSRTSATGADADKIKAIYSQLDEISNAYGSHLSESDLKSVVQNLQKLGWSLEGSPRTSLQGQALQELSGVYNEVLKSGNQSYAEAMKPVQEAVTNLGSLERHFINKQAPEEVNKFINTAKRFGMPSQNTAAVNSVQKAGQGLEDDILDSVAKNAFQKSDTNGSRKTLAGSIIGGATGAIMGPAGAIVGSAVGGAAGQAADKYAGQIFKQMLNGRMVASEGIAKVAPYLGKWAKPLMDAAQRGNAAVSAAHFILQNRDQEYRELTKKLMSGE